LQVAAKLTSALGREVLHVKLTGEQRFQSLVGHGLPEHFARFLESIEVGTSNGDEDRVGDDVERVTGQKPTDFDTFAQENKAVWQ
jgi:hypothetical protein